MDYRQIDQLMTAKNLTNDPAFENAIIAIEPILRTDGCPLGLYFPVKEWSPHVQRVVAEGTLILPPDATEGAALHELGHRHAHYHYEDLSERAAEDFRKRYQKGRALLYLGNDFNKLAKFGALFEEGEKGAIEIALLQPLTPDVLSEVKNELYSCGERPKVFYGNSEVPWLRVEFTKGVDWPVIIMSTLLGMTALSVGLMGYGVYKVAKEIPWAAPVLIFGAISAFILAGAYRQKILGKVR